ncbi:piggyBac transposable element-derived protein 4-like [Conger conger]|uniref:piggyBac transposable element-derived protein 4-like n=1 Tax=Conger conger TaxID=82655 RepID=UPI002A59B701|nr:piggyBac transposable element-derived protein 4-like [Conger conger]
MSAHWAIRMTPGPTTLAVSKARDIASTFRLFITPAIEKIILEMTNMEGFRKCGEGWKTVDEMDLRAYMGLLILAGVYRARGEPTASLWSAETGRAIFHATMPLRTFNTFSRMIRFDNRESRPGQCVPDKLAPIRDVWEKWTERLPCLYNPGPEVTVAERLVPFRGRCPFRQYLPRKPGRCGVKIWTVCDARSSYAWNMRVCTGRAASAASEKSRGVRALLDMTKGLRGCNITCNRVFTSYELGQELLKRKMTMVGEVMKNKPELPAAVLTMKGRAVASSRFAFTPTTTLLSYCPKRNRSVVHLSTLHTDADVRGCEDRKPAIVIDYNHNKGGVDNLEKVTRTYSCKKATARWPLAIFYNIIDVTAHDAFVIWNEVNPTWMAGGQNKRRVFLEQLGRALVTPRIQRRTHVPRTATSAALVRAVQWVEHGPVPSEIPSAAVRAGKRRRCYFCPTKKDCKTNTMCCKCEKYICNVHACRLAFCRACTE